MVVKFADYWKEETGQYPARLLFDWRTTTYASLSQLTEAPGCGSGHSFRFVRCFPYLVAGRGVARNSAGFGKRTANCNAF